ncbi:MAG: MmcQ/YjbR family DNA-binding protein [Micromonosporaceae bacterium]
MTSVDEVREIALSFPGAHQSGHFDVTDFRVNNKIFCTLPPKPGQMGLRITASEQAALIAEAPETFTPGPGKWGEQGWTMVRLDQVDPVQLRELIAEAWRIRAPKRMVAEFDAER